MGQKVSAQSLIKIRGFSLKFTVCYSEIHSDLREKTGEIHYVYFFQWSERFGRVGASRAEAVIVILLALVIGAERVRIGHQDDQAENLSNDEVFTYSAICRVFFIEAPCARPIYFNMCIPLHDPTIAELLQG